MNILFVHQGFPGQFKHLAPALAAQGHHVVAMTMRRVKASKWQGVQLVPYGVSRSSTPGIHSWIVDFESKVIRAEACMRVALQMKARGYVPDVIIAHHGWGESLFLKEVWPKARMGLYCEFYYHPQGADTGFDPEFPIDRAEMACKLRLKNLNNLLHFDQANAGISPTHWQASTFPEQFRNKITVIHDGIDTTSLVPNHEAHLTISGGLRLTRDDEVITFANRNLEPYRGYHIFMRALPELLERRPRAQVLIVGGEGVGYGGKPNPVKYGARSWKQVFIDEVRSKIPDSNWARVHFLGNIPYPQFVALLQISSLHLYWTYPFVLSWSLLEAMSIGCPILASNTSPLREVIQDDVSGRLIDFFDVEALVQEATALLDDKERAHRYGKSARASVQMNFDLQTVCLPAQLAWVQKLMV